MLTEAPENCLDLRPPFSSVHEPFTHDRADVQGVLPASHALSGGERRMSPPDQPTIEMPEGEQLLTAGQVAHRWRVSWDTVYRVPAVYSPPLKLGPNTRRYRLEDVMEYEQQSLHGGR